MRKFLCRIGVHSWFQQWDRWGSADVCRYCVAVGAVHEVGRRAHPMMPESCEWHVHSMFHPCPNGLYRRDYLFGPMPRTVKDVLANHEIRKYAREGR